MGKDEAIALGKTLWVIANTLRGKMDADDFRDYMLGFIFFKYLSENYDEAAKKILNADLTNSWESFSPEEKKIVETELVKTIGYFIEPKHLWFNFAKKSQNKEPMLDDLKQAFQKIETSTIGTESEQDFMGLFSEIQLDSNKLGEGYNERNKLICKIIQILDQNLETHSTSRDDLGDAYEFLIAEFAANSGKKAGEFYTPQKISTLLSRIVTVDTNSKSIKTYLNSIYDPTCGSGSLLFNVYKQMNGEVREIFGQESNPTTYNLARMNLLLHKLKYKEFRLTRGDTLINPAIDKNQKFEAIVANPPFSLTWTPEAVMQDDRFRGYALPPKDKADFAFILHMLYHLADNGTCAVVVPHGILFRGGSEKSIRQTILTAGLEKKGYLDAVIGLPSGLFYSTGIPVCILVFQKCRMQDEILFIDASKNFIKEKKQNSITDEHLDKIIDAFIHRKEIEKFSRNVTLKEIEENDYNLNIPRYVDTAEEEEILDTQMIVNQIKDLDDKIKDNDLKIKAFCNELGINYWMP